MKKNLIKIVFIVLAVTIFFSNFNVNVYARIISDVDGVSLNKLVNIPNKKNDEKMESDINIAVQDDRADSIELEPNIITNIPQGDTALVNYFLVESPFIQAPATQKFVFSFGDGTQNISSMSLFFQRDNGVEQEISLTTKQNNLYVFEHSFNNADIGTYRVTKIQYTLDNQIYEIVLSDMQIDARFGVNMQYDGYGESEGVVLDQNGNQIETTPITDELASSLVSLNEESTDEVTSIVEDTIEGNIPNTNGRSLQSYTKSNPLVIALDPGHGGMDSGMTAVNGVGEKVFTLQIANYLKAELEKYSNVKVVMTRTNDTYIDLEPRAEKAKQLGASVLISLHLNALNGGIQGAEVYYPNANYSPSAHQTGLNLAQNVLRELTGLGITNRGIHVKYVSDTVTGQPAHDPKYDYADGSVGDYYGIIRHSKKRGIAAIIIEHCYADNWSDFNRFLSSDQKIQNLALADVRGIINAFGLTQVNRDEVDQLAVLNKNILKDGTYEISSLINPRSVLDVSGGSQSNGANVQIYSNNYTDAQGWIVTHDSKGYVTFTNVNSKKALDVNSCKAQNGQNVQQYDFNDSYAQKWIVTKEEKGYKVISAINPNYVLDLSGGKTENGRNIQIYESNDSEAQRWNFEKYISMKERMDVLAQENKNILKDGTYEISSLINPRSVLDVSGGSQSNGANVQIYSNNYTDAQGWIVTHDSKGYVTFTNVNSKKALDVNSCKAQNGQNVQQYDFNDSYAQKWIVTKEEKGYKVISAINPNYVLDLSGGKTENGRNIQIYESNDSEAQRWDFNKFQTKREQLNEIASQNKALMDDGYYIVKSADVNHALDINDNNVFLANLSKRPSQKWKISHDEKGYILFENAETNKFLGVNTDSAVNNINVIQQNYSDNYSQKWIIVMSKNGKLSIVSALDKNYVLDIANGILQHGSNVQLYQSNNSLAQNWIFENTSFNESERLTPIMGTSDTTVTQMVNMFKRYNKNYDVFSKYKGEYDGALKKGGAPTIEDYCTIFYEEARIEGVRVDVAFSQAMVETGWLTFGGDVKPNQYNFAGLGATGNGAIGAEFKDVRTGIRAQIQHLKCYASTEPLKQDRVDPRWGDWLRGKAIYVEYLSIPNNPYGTGWAADKDYAKKILNIVNAL